MKRERGKERDREGKGVIFDQHTYLALILRSPGLYISSKTRISKYIISCYTSLLYSFRLNEEK